MFPFAIGNKQGSASWSWLALPLSKQKLCDVKKFDPDSELFKRCAHMLLNAYAAEVCVVNLFFPSGN